jgi:TRAP transporter TAXI family solute receptor
VLIGHKIRVLICTLISFLWVAGCSPATVAVPPPARVLRAVFAGAPFGQELAAEYNRADVSVYVELVETRGDSTLQALVRGDADIAILPADTLYFAYRNSLQTQLSRARLRAIAKLHVLPQHLLVRADSGIRQLTDLRSSTLRTFIHMPVQRLIMTTVASDTKAIERNLASGLLARSEMVALIGSRLVGDGTADAAFIGASYPSDVVHDALRRGAHLVPIEGQAVKRMQQQYRFVRQIAIPAGVYPGYPQPIPTIGVDLTYICRSDLDEGLVYQLAGGLFDALPTLAKKFPALRVFDVEQAPATPIPLHEGAARYYREVELLQ